MKLWRAGLMLSIVLVLLTPMQVVSPTKVLTSASDLCWDTAWPYRVPGTEMLVRRANLLVHNSRVYVPVVLRTISQ